MALPIIFGPLTAAQMSELDQDFAAVGALTTIQGTVTGTNSLVHTPAANQPAVSGYGLPNPIKFGFTAAATSTGAVTFEVSSFGFLPVYTTNGIQATTGTLVSGNYYEVTYTTGAIYNSGSGAWVLSSYQSGTGTVPVAPSTVRGLKVVNNAGTPSTQIDISFQQACLVSATGTPAFLGILSATIDLTTGTVTSTANGMDGESRPATGWVYIYAISTGSGMAGLGTTVSPLAGPPTLPAGYAYYAFLGAMFCDGSSNLMRTRQLGPDTQYVVTTSTNTPGYPAIATGSAGTINSGTYTPTNKSVSNIVPPTASKLHFQLVTLSAGGASAAVTPNPNFGGSSATSAPFPPPFVIIPNNTTVSPPIAGEIILESTNVSYAASASSGALYGIGWTDYVSAAA